MFYRDLLMWAPLLYERVEIAGVHSIAYFLVCLQVLTPFQYVILAGI